MCVIIYKPKNVELPTTEFLKKAWETNPDGAGLARPIKSEWEILKGFFNFDKFAEVVANCDPTEPLILHLRIATSGLIDGGNCHPYPISSKKERLRATYTKSKLIFAHNGVLPINNNDPDLNDSQELASRLSKIGIKSAESCANLLDGLTAGNRLIFADATEIYKIGDWTEYNGLFLSNTIFLSQNYYYSDVYSDFYNAENAFLDCLDDYKEATGRQKKSIKKRLKALKAEYERQTDRLDEYEQATYAVEGEKWSY